MSKPQMPQMTPDQWESLATAVDALSSALAAVRPLAEWEMDLLSAATPEPDPWPTAPLIVADWIAGAAKGHGLLYLDGHEYVTIESGHVLREGRDTLTNVVPVTVVPTAEWRTVRDAAYIRGSVECDRDYWARVGKQAVYAVTTTDALEVDQ